MQADPDGARRAKLEGYESGVGDVLQLDGHEGRLARQAVCEHACVIRDAQGLGRGAPEDLNSSSVYIVPRVVC